MHKRPVPKTAPAPEPVKIADWKSEEAYDRVVSHIYLAHGLQTSVGGYREVKPLYVDNDIAHYRISFRDKLDNITSSFSVRVRPGDNYTLVDLSKDRSKPRTPVPTT